MVKIVDGVIVNENEQASPLMNGNTMPSNDFNLNVNICEFKFNKWMILGVVFICTLLGGFKGLMLSILVFFAAYVMGGGNNTNNSFSVGSSQGGSAAAPSTRKGPRIMGVSDLPKPARG